MKKHLLKMLILLSITLIAGTTIVGSDSSNSTTWPGASKGTSSNGVNKSYNILQVGTNYLSFNPNGISLLTYDPSNDKWTSEKISDSSQKDILENSFFPVESGGIQGFISSGYRLLGFAAPPEKNPCLLPILAFDVTYGKNKNVTFTQAGEPYYINYRSNYINNGYILEPGMFNTIYYDQQYNVFASFILSEQNGKHYLNSFLHSGVPDTSGFLELKKMAMCEFTDLFPKFTDINDYTNVFCKIMKVNNELMAYLILNSNDTSKNDSMILLSINLSKVFNNMEADIFDSVSAYKGYTGIQKITDFSIDFDTIYSGQQKIDAFVGSLQDYDNYKDKLCLFLGIRNDKYQHLVAWGLDQNFNIANSYYGAVFPTKKNQVDICKFIKQVKQDSNKKTYLNYVWFGGGKTYNFPSNYIENIAPKGNTIKMTLPGSYKSLPSILGIILGNIPMPSQLMNYFLNSGNASFKWINQIGYVASSSDEKDKSSTNVNDASVSIGWTFEGSDGAMAENFGIKTSFKTSFTGSFDSKTTKSNSSGNSVSSSNSGLFTQTTLSSSIKPGNIGYLICFESFGSIIVTKLKSAEDSTLKDCNGNTLDIVTSIPVFNSGQLTAKEFDITNPGSLKSLSPFLKDFPSMPTTANPSAWSSVSLGSNSPTSWRNSSDIYETNYNAIAFSTTGMNSGTMKVGNSSGWSDTQSYTMGFDWDNQVSTEGGTLTSSLKDTFDIDTSYSHTWSNNTNVTKNESTEISYYYYPKNEKYNFDLEGKIHMLNPTKDTDISNCPWITEAMRNAGLKPWVITYEVTSYTPPTFKQSWITAHPSALTTTTYPVKGGYYNPQTVNGGKPSSGNSGPVKSNVLETYDLPITVSGKQGMLFILSNETTDKVSTKNVGDLYLTFGVKGQAIKLKDNVVCIDSSAQGKSMYIFDVSISNNGSAYPGEKSNSSYSVKSVSGNNNGMILAGSTLYEIKPDKGSPTIIRNPLGSGYEDVTVLDYSDSIYFICTGTGKTQNLFEISTNNLSQKYMTTFSSTSLAAKVKVVLDYPVVYDKDGNIIAQIFPGSKFMPENINTVLNSTQLNSVSSQKAPLGKYWGFTTNPKTKGTLFKLSESSDTYYIPKSTNEKTYTFSFADSIGGNTPELVIYNDKSILKPAISFNAWAKQNINLFDIWKSLYPNDSFALSTEENIITNPNKPNQVILSVIMSKDTTPVTCYLETLVGDTLLYRDSLGAYILIYSLGTIETPQYVGWNQIQSKLNTENNGTFIFKGIMPFYYASIIYFYVGENVYAYDMSVANNSSNLTINPVGQTGNIAKGLLNPECPYMIDNLSLTTDTDTDTSLVKIKCTPKNGLSTLKKYNLTKPITFNPLETKSAHTLTLGSISNGYKINQASTPIYAKYDQLTGEIKLTDNKTDNKPGFTIGGYASDLYLSTNSKEKKCTRAGSSSGQIIYINVLAEISDNQNGGSTNPVMSLPYIITDNSMFITGWNGTNFLAHVYYGSKLVIQNIGELPDFVSDIALDYENQNLYVSYQNIPNVYVYNLETKGSSYDVIPTAVFYECSKNSKLCFKQTGSSNDVWELVILPSAGGTHSQPTLSSYIKGTNKIGTTILKGVTNKTYSKCEAAIENGKIPTYKYSLVNDNVIGENETASYSIKKIYDLADIGGSKVQLYISGLSELLLWDTNNITLLDTNVESVTLGSPVQGSPITVNYTNGTKYSNFNISKTYNISGNEQTILSYHNNILVIQSKSEISSEWFKSYPFKSYIANTVEPSIPNDKIYSHKLTKDPGILGESSELSEIIWLNSPGSSKPGFIFNPYTDNSKFGMVYDLTNGYTAPIEFTESLPQSELFNGNPYLWGMPYVSFTYNKASSPVLNIECWGYKQKESYKSMSQLMSGSGNYTYSLINQNFKCSDLDDILSHSEKQLKNVLPNPLLLLSVLGSESQEKKFTYGKTQYTGNLIQGTIGGVSVYSLGKDYLAYYNSKTKTSFILSKKMGGVNTTLKFTVDNKNVFGTVMGITGSYLVYYIDMPGSSNYYGYYNPSNKNSFTLKTNFTFETIAEIGKYRIFVKKDGTVSFYSIPEDKFVSLPLVINGINILSYINDTSTQKVSFYSQSSIESPKLDLQGLSGKAYYWSDYTANNTNISQGLNTISFIKLPELIVGISDSNFTVQPVGKNINIISYNPNTQIEKISFVSALSNSAPDFKLEGASGKLYSWSTYTKATDVSGGYNTITLTNLPEAIVGISDSSITSSPVGKNIIIDSYSPENKTEIISFYSTIQNSSPNYVLEGISGKTYTNKWDAYSNSSPVSAGYNTINLINVPEAIVGISDSDIYAVKSEEPIKLYSLMTKSIILPAHHSVTVPSGLSIKYDGYYYNDDNYYFKLASVPAGSTITVATKKGSYQFDNNADSNWGWGFYFKGDYLYNHYTVYYYDGGLYYIIGQASSSQSKTVNSDKTERLTTSNIETISFQVSKPHVPYGLNTEYDGYYYNDDTYYKLASIPAGSTISVATEESSYNIGEGTGECFKGDYLYNDKTVYYCDGGLYYLSGYSSGTPISSNVISDKVERLTTSNVETISFQRKLLNKST